MVVTKAEFARLRGVSKPTVTNAVKAGRLVHNGEGKIDLENPVNAIYSPRTVLPRGKAPAATGPKKAKAARVPEVEATGGDSEAGEDGQLPIAKMRAEVEKIRAQTRLHRLQEAKIKGQVIPRDLFVFAVQAINDSIQANLMRLPLRLAPTLIAMVKSGQSNLEVTAEIEKTISAAVKASVEDGCRSLEMYAKK